MHLVFLLLFVFMLDPDPEENMRDKNSTHLKQEVHYLSIFMLSTLQKMRKRVKCKCQQRRHRMLLCCVKSQ